MEFLTPPQIVPPPGTVLVRDAWGQPYFAEATPGLQSQRAALELQAGMTGASALRDKATLADYDRCYARRTSQQFCVWATVHQVPVRTALALDLEARAQGKPFAAPTESLSAQSAARPRPCRPLCAAGELETMSVGPGATLAQLEEAGLVNASLSEAAFDGRLKRLKLDLSSRTHLMAQAYEARYFRYTPQGDTAMVDHLPPSRYQTTMGGTRRGQVINEIRAALDRLDTLGRKAKG